MADIFMMSAHSQAGTDFVSQRQIDSHMDRCWLIKYTCRLSQIIWSRLGNNSSLSEDWSESALTWNVHFRERSASFIDRLGNAFITFFAFGRLDPTSSKLLEPFDLFYFTLLWMEVEPIQDEMGYPTRRRIASCTRPCNRLALSNRNKRPCLPHHGSLCNMLPTYTIYSNIQPARRGNMSNVKFIQWRKSVLARSLSATRCFTGRHSRRPLCLQQLPLGATKSGKDRHSEWRKKDWILYWKPLMAPCFSIGSKRINNESIQSSCSIHRIYHWGTGYFWIWIVLCKFFWTIVCQVTVNDQFSHWMSSDVFFVVVFL